MINLHIYPSYLTNESRLLKESKSLISNKLVSQIVIAGFWKTGLNEKELVEDHIEIIRLNCYFGKLSKLKIFNSLPFLIFYLKCFTLAIKRKVGIVNCHALTVLPLCFFIKKILRCKLIYDPHELETETHESKGMRRKIARMIEGMFIEAADYCIVVGDSIKSWYIEAYGLTKIEVIKNIPSRVQLKIDPIDLKRMFDIAPAQILFIYQGFLSQSRGVNSILDTFLKVDDKHIIFMGFGPLEDLIKSKAMAAPNIHFLPAAKPSEVLHITAGADVGIHIIPNTCLNHYYCLPNKVFEYMLAGVPFIVSNFPDIRNEFESADVAWFVGEDSNNFEQIVRSIDIKSLTKKKSNCLLARKIWNWENQDETYIKIYNALLSTYK